MVARDKSKFKIRELAVAAATCSDLVSRKVLRKRAKRARREFEGGAEASPSGKTARRQSMKAHSERCNDDKEEPTLFLVERTKNRGSGRY